MDNLALWWFGLGGALLVIEMFTGTLFFLWLSAAALVTALLCFLLGLGLPVSLAVFAAAGLLSFFGWYRFRPRHLDQREAGAHVNNRLAGLVGREAVLQEAVVHGRGRVNIDDAWWQVRADEDLPAGSRIKVQSLDGMVLLISAVKTN